MACICLGLAACTPGDKNDAKLMPRPPPPPEISVPAELRIPVTVNGAPAAAIDAARLNRQPPSFHDGEHRAWRLDALVSGLEPGAQVTVSGENEVQVSMPWPSRPGELVPALALSRRGEVVVALVSPSDPFPDFHGQGRRLARGGDPLPRVTGRIREIRVSTASTAAHGGEGGGGGERKDERAQQEVEAPLVARIDGQSVEWSIEKLREVPKHELDGKKDGWSLRELVAKLVGPKARVLSLTGAAKRRLEISPAAWKDAARTPILRVNRQGQYKFQWHGGSGPISEDDELRNVRVVEISAKEK